MKKAMFFIIFGLIAIVLVSCMPLRTTELSEDEFNKFLRKGSICWN